MPGDTDSAAANFIEEEPLTRPSEGTVGRGDPIITAAAQVVPAPRAAGQPRSRPHRRHHISRPAQHLCRLTGHPNNLCLPLQINTADATYSAVWLATRRTQMEDA